MAHIVRRILAGAVVSFSVFLGAQAFLATPAAAEEVWDPIESTNRGIFWFNDQFDMYLLEPVARGYDWLLPDEVQSKVGNFFGNLRYPSYLVSDLVQLKFDQAGEHTARFLINTTLGVAGLFDVASEFGLEDHREDFGIALAYHGVPAGPYLMIPFYGPTNARDGIGRIVDTVLDPLVIFSYTSNADAATKDWVTWGGLALRTIDQRAGLIDAIDSAKTASVDYYLFVQGAYYQYRRGLLYDGNPPDEEDLSATPESPDETSAKEPKLKESPPEPAIP